MDNAQIEAFLATQSWLAPLEEFDRTALAAALQVQTFKPGDAIISQGDKASQLFLLVEGGVAVEIEKDGATRRIRVMEPGALFGILALVDHRPRSAACIATTDVTVCVLEKTVFDMLAHQHARIAYPFQRALGAQLAADFRWAVSAIEDRLIAIV